MKKQTSIKNRTPAAKRPYSQCQDAVRAFFHERIGRYFEIPSGKDVSGTCGVCGAEIIAPALDSNKNPRCLAQNVIAQNRPRPALGFPISHNSPPLTKAKKVKIGGKYVEQQEVKVSNRLATTGAITLITPSYVYIAANALPSRPLPEGTVAEVVIPGIHNKFWKEFFKNPPETPFFLAVWDKKNNIPLVMTENLERTAINGKDKPEYVNIPKLRKLIALYERLGKKDFDATVSAKSKFSGLVDGPEFLRKRQEIMALQRKHNLTTEDFRSIPTPESEDLNKIRQAIDPEFSISASVNKELS